MAAGYDKARDGQLALPSTIAPSADGTKSAGQPASTQLGSRHPARAQTSSEETHAFIDVPPPANGTGLGPRSTAAHTRMALAAAASEEERLESEYGGLEAGQSGVQGARSLASSSPAQVRERRRRKKYRYAVLYSAVFSIAFAISLDSNTGYLYLNWACSEYGALSAFSTVSIVQQLTMAIAKPPLAKISDVFGRAQAYAFSLALYVLGYIIVTFSASLRTLLCGLMLVSAGITGLQTLQSIIVADTTAPRYRGLVIGLCNIPFLINFLIAGPLVDLVLRNGTWRLGYGMWIIAMPIAAAPLLVTLAIGQRNARRAGLRHRILDEGQNAAHTLRILATELDVGGIVFFSLSFALMLLPITLVSHGSSVDMGVAKLLFILGLVLLVAFIKWEAFVKEPLLPLRFFTNKTVVLVCLIGIADFGSFFLSWSFLSSFVQVVKGWDQTQTGWFASTQNVTSTAQGILVGLIMTRQRRFKRILVWGVVIRLVGVALMIKYRNSDDPTIALVLCQLLQGIGGGSIAIVMQVGVQIAVQRKDVAAVTALELLTAEIGAAIGSALAGVLFATDLPKRLAAALPELSLREREAIYSSLQVALSYPLGSPIRNGISDAWVSTMRLLCITATLFLLPALFCALALPDLKLPERHNHLGRVSKQIVDTLLLLQTSDLGNIEVHLNRDTEVPASGYVEVIGKVSDSGDQLREFTTVYFGENLDLNLVEQAVQVAAKFPEIFSDPEAGN
ncbi:hypothetical protein OC835_000301 [Tilletia horrida]|nr:hypothetical protein OC835_000301 [Tilletia horrida]